MKLLVTGGGGFIGSNTADHFLNNGHDVVVLDNFSRYGSLINLEWLKQRHGKSLTILPMDLRNDPDKLVRIVDNCDFVFHFAGQVAVTTSVADPRDDFENNAVGTFNLLEAVRLSESNPPLVYTSTNKVYGGLKQVPIEESGTRYGFQDREGVDESMQLDFHSPYGCSKGVADQYCKDYQRIYGIKTAILRQSAIYGIRQFGIEDQGWVAHFIISALIDRPVTVYGDGKQVRDILYISDLIALYEILTQKIEEVSGEVFNVGGGPGNTLSPLELLDFIDTNLENKMPRNFSDWRPGDQKVYISDNSKADKMLGWSPAVSVKQGLTMLWEWCEDNKEYFVDLLKKK